MPPYVIITLIAFALFATAAVIDKILLRRAVPEPAVYTFAISLLGLLAFVLAPWGFTVPESWVLIEALVAGSFFTTGLFVFFCALKAYEASRVIPIVGSLVAIETLLGETWFLEQRLSSSEFTAFVVLVTGGLFLMYERRSGRVFLSKQTALGLLTLTLLASIFLAVSFVFTKLVYEQESFINGLIWIRVGGALTALLFLFRRKTRQSLLIFKDKVAPRFQALLILGQIFGGLGALLQNLAIKLGDVSIVTALQGSQYGFLFLFVILLARRWPEALAEHLSRASLIQKLIGTIIIIFGLVLFRLFPKLSFGG